LYQEGEGQTSKKSGNELWTLGDKVCTHFGDITKLKVDAIVNAAKETLLGGGGIDGVIHKAAGKKLLKECKTLNGCKTGEAKITSGYDLPAKKIIHAVGPIGENKEKLKSAYESSLQLMIHHNLKTIAFPCISTGIFKYPAHNAALVAIETVKEFLEKNHEKVDKVIFCLYNQSDVDIYNKLMPLYFPRPNIEKTLGDKIFKGAMQAIEHSQWKSIGSKTYRAGNVSMFCSN
jgi:O-acetyl-ADP-ribose deacetylase (regulator of RNase III)